MAAIAAVDLGTNSTRVLVAREDGSGGIQALHRANTITRLGQGVDASGRLTPEAIRRTLDCVDRYRTVLEKHDVDLARGTSQVRVAATSAARDAANRDDLFDPIEEALGTRPELLTGIQEGTLTFQGATGDLDPEMGPFLVVDIGGGSTEFVVGHSGRDGAGPEIEGVLSADVGCVRLTEKYLEHDPPRPEELSAAISVTDAHIEDVLRELPTSGSAKTLVGVAGTITTAAAVERGLVVYDRDLIHHFRLTHAAAEDVFRTLATESREDRIHNPGLEEARADVIVGGLCILVAIYRRLGFDEMTVSESDILDGLAFSLV